jgi:D-galactarolactone cycloisomerase
MPEAVKITSIGLHLVECLLPEPQGNASAFFDRRSALLVEVRTDEGIAGWGETWHSPPAAWTIIETMLASSVLGQDPLEHRRLWHAMHGNLGYERQGPGLMALSAVDMALWDLRGRALRQPIARLLGGPVRTRVGAYAGGPYLRPGRDPYRGYRREAERIVAPGFRALKMKIGVDPAADGRAAAAVRRVVGPDVVLLADANQGYTPRPAIEAGRHLEAESFAWLEEPVAPDDVDGYAQVAGALGLAVVGGEALGGIRAFRTFFERNALDAAQPDLAIAGGFTEVMRIAALAAAWEVPVVPHVWGTAVNFYASLQLAAVLPGYRSHTPMPYPWFEYDQSPNPLRELWGVPSVGPDGMVEVPQGPGLGIEIDPRAFEPYLLRRGEVTPD